MGEQLYLLERWGNYERIIKGPYNKVGANAALSRHFEHDWTVYSLTEIAVAKKAVKTTTVTYTREID